MTLRPFQEIAVSHAVAWRGAATTGSRIMYSSPTGTGKSYIIAELARRLSGRTYIVTPRVEIVQGFAQKGFTEGVFTPIKLRNALAKDAVPPPDTLIVDESHHSTASSYKELLLLCDNCPAIGYTATPFRGTPKGTADLHDFWTELVPISTYPWAVENKYIQMPSINVVPILDDDIISLSSSGEFSVEAANDACNSILGSVLDTAAKDFSGTWRLPSVFSMPGRESVLTLCDVAAGRGLPIVPVLDDTCREDRDRHFAECLEGKVAIAQINVVSEGIDLPLRLLFDAQPTMSPVRWLQTFGRIMRPGEGSEYTCFNRNILRHGYLLDGLVPSGVIASAEKGFGGIGARAAIRTVGYETLGKFKPAEVPLLDGTTGQLYCVSKVDGHRVTQYTILTTPRFSEPIVARRENIKQGSYGTWERLDEIPVLDRGFASVPAGRLSEKQLAWWKRSAKSQGLNPDVEPNARAFQALPLLFNLKN